MQNRVTERMKIILNSELETFKHFKDAEKMFPEIKISSKDLKNANDISSRLNGSILDKPKINLIGAKRKANQNNNPEYKFVYRYNEGVTNKVNRSLNFNYFFTSY